MKKEVDGIILILSCQKHKDTRLKETRLPYNNYNNWEVVYVIGDFLLVESYKLKDDILYIRCEDSYIHLLKKLTLSIKYIKELFEIKEGILRCGDDLLFNEDNLIAFTKSVKYDYYGQSYYAKSYTCHDISILKKVKYDNFMVHYYNDHKEDFDNIHHNLKGVDMLMYTKRPDLYGAVGVIYYLSNKAINVLLEHMKSIDYNIFTYDEFTKSYPYTIEDCAVSFIMYSHQIPFTDSQRFLSDSNFPMYPETIVRHTNLYK